MISIELLRRYPFFSMLTDDQLKAIAMIAEEKTYPKETLLVKENTPGHQTHPPARRRCGPYLQRWRRRRHFQCPGGFDRPG